MDAFLINGKKQLSGKISVSGAKNAILPIMTATLLTEGKSILHNVPHINDFKMMSHLLRIIGARVEHENNTMQIDSSNAGYWEAPYELVSKMRASIYVLGPLLAKFNKASVAFPGGCAIGTRPVDLHLMAIEKLGANITIEHGYINANCPDGLVGAEITFPFISVGATANTLMAAVLAKGKSILNNIALEPEIDSLISFLNKMGAKIKHLHNNSLEIIGVDKLSPVEMTMIPDRIEAGTLLLSSAITKNSFTICNCEPQHLISLIEKMELAGCKFEISDGNITVFPAEMIKPVDITTEAYPGFPTDLQAQFMSYMTLANGKCQIKETIFPDRFMHIAELNRLGANIQINNGIAEVSGVKKLSGAEVMATDLRASAALVLAGLAAEGETTISRIYHIDRGYEKIEQKLNAIGADIKRIIQ
jgi:UDP-N-acetylglucosamine 1-carboxyvinyltransferase